jgi:hypothetical protein
VDLTCRSGRKSELDSYNGIVEVDGSIPSGSTNNIKGLVAYRLAPFYFR